MKIGIDARFYGSIGKGLGRYTQKLIENLEKTDQENLYFIFLRQDNFDEYQPKNPRFKKVLADYRWYTIAEQINMPRLLDKYDLDLVHFPHFNVPIFYRKRFIVTIHDLILIHFPTIRGTTLNPIFYWVKFWVYKLVINLAIKRAEKIIAVSNFTKKDILSNYLINPNKISVIHEACDDFCNFSNQKKEAILDKYGIMKPYILYVGNAYPHKNLEELVLGFSQVEREINNLRLVLVGKEDYFYSRLEKIVKNKEIEKIVFSGFVPDKDLDTVYREAEFYVFPSLYEGFGLPPLEAMAKGVPVISSDHQCMKEILGDSALYFNAKDRDEMAEKIKFLFGNSEKKKELREKGYQKIKEYSWKKMALETLATYEIIK